MKKLKIVAIVTLATCIGMFVSCMSAAIDPQKAATELAPITRTATKNSEGVYYCIFVRSFADSDGDGVGDFNGITEKLDYLNDGDDTTTDDLGVTGIWLMPIYDAGSYHGYDVKDYYSVNPDYGTMEDFDAMVAAARERGISVILDITCNHSSVNNQWFLDSMDPDDPHHDWYRWARKGDINCNIDRKIWGHAAWRYATNGWYYAGLFDSCMPDFNLANEDVKKEFSKITKFWLDKGVTGFRFDAVSHVFNAAELRSGESTFPASNEWWSYITDEIESNYADAWNVGECWEATPLRAKYAESLQSLFHFDLGKRISSALKVGNGGQNGIAKLFASAGDAYKEVNPEYIDATFLTNHDQTRFMTLINNPDAAKQKEQMKCAAAIYMTAEGVPFIYYGEEIGMKGANPGDERVRTPFIWNEKSKTSPSWYSEQFGTIDTQNKDTTPLNVQEKDDNSIVEYYKRIIRIKTAYPELYRGRMTPLWTGSKQLTSWLMSDTAEAGVVDPTIASGKTAFVVHNVSNTVVTVDIPKEALAQISGTDLIFSGNGEVSLVGTTLTMPAYSSAIIGELAAVPQVE
ncbi:MAG: hypothetical protein BKP49_05600 [Treponema sp. CETP13]|nr:MAG: hypothetical protein BKP49_05600 [Treponema sp. CETP13]